MTKELSDEIAAGLQKGFWYPLFVILLTITIISIGMLAYSFYQDYAQEECVRTGKCIQTAMPVNTIQCYVVIGNGTNEISTYGFTLTSYQEANAKYEQLKPRIVKTYNNEIIKFNWIIQRLECD